MGSTVHARTIFPTLSLTMVLLSGCGSDEPSFTGSRVDVPDDEVRSELLTTLTAQGVMVAEDGDELVFDPSKSTLVYSELSKLFNPTYDRSMALPDRREMTGEFGVFLQEAGMDIQIAQQDAGQVIRYKSEDASTVHRMMDDFFAFRLPSLDAE